MKLGVVFDIVADDGSRKLKDVAQVKATQPLSDEMLRFIEWTAKYNCVSPGLVLRMVVRSYKALDPSPLVTQFSSSGVLPSKMSAAREAILERGGPFPARASEIAERAGVSSGVVRGFENAGGLTSQSLPVDGPFGVPDAAHGGMTLTAAQRAASDDLIAQVAKHDFNVSLLDGVTGSGKTEVYFEAVAEALKNGGQALVLVPEIALTQAGMSRFEARFGVAPAPWHSQLGDAPRRRVWREVAQGRAQLVVGARSALYLPFPKLRLIVVDEEHDTSYKQEEGVIYSARDMAVVRAKIAKHSVVLASATPSLESLVNAQQAMLYLNRRGYAPLIICRNCGEKLKSPDTDSWLVEHRRTGRAVCHQTGFSMRMPTACPECKVEDSLTPVGPGVERVAEEAARHFPEAKIAYLSNPRPGRRAGRARR